MSALGCLKIAPVVFALLLASCNTGTGSKTEFVFIDPPGAFSADVVDQTQVQLGWEDVDNDEGYIIARSESPVGPFDTQYTIEANAVSFVDEDVGPGSRYYYKIRVDHPDGTSSWSDLILVSLSSVPTTPVLDSTETTDTTITLAWDLEPGTDTYELERALQSNGPYQVLANLDGATQSYQDVGLEAGTNYFYRMAAGNEVGYSPHSGVLSVSTTNIEGSAPSNVRVEASSPRAVELRWDNHDPSYWYEIARAEGGRDESGTAEANFATLATQRSPGGVYVVSGLSVETTYRFRLRVSDLSSRSDWSPVVEITTLPLPPDRPLVPTVSANSSSSVEVSWSAIDGADRYRLERALSGSGPFNPVGEETEERSLEDGALDADTTYYYRLIAINSGGESDAGPIASVTTDPVDVTLGVEPGDRTELALDLEEGTEFVGSGTQSVSVSPEGDAHAWYMDGELLSGNTSATAALDLSSLALGSHRLTVVVTIGGVRESVSVSFRVVEG